MCSCHPRELCDEAPAPGREAGRTGRPGGGRAEGPGVLDGAAGRAALGWVELGLPGEDGQSHWTPLPSLSALCPHVVTQQRLASLRYLCYKRLVEVRVPRPSPNQGQRRGASERGHAPGVTSRKGCIG